MTMACMRPSSLEHRLACALARQFLVSRLPFTYGCIRDRGNHDVVVSINRFQYHSILLYIILPNIPKY